jgi:hypothetical protein
MRDIARYRQTLAGTALAYGHDMFTVILVPLMCVVSLVVLVVSGAWPMSWLSGITAMALLVAVVIGLGLALRKLDSQQPERSPSFARRGLRRSRWIV